MNDDDKRERLRALELELDDVVVAAIVGGLDFDDAVKFMGKYSERALAKGEPRAELLLDGGRARLFGGDDDQTHDDDSN